MFWGTLKNGGRLFNKLFFAPKIFSVLRIIEVESYCCVSGPGDISVALVSMKALGFHHKYLSLCSEDERVWGVINDSLYFCLNYPFNQSCPVTLLRNSPVSHQPQSLALPRRLDPVKKAVLCPGARPCSRGERTRAEGTGMEKSRLGPAGDRRAAVRCDCTRSDGPCLR